MAIERRMFLKAGGIALVGLGLDPLFLTRAAYAVRRTSHGKPRTLICIFQRGALDGLNVVIPHGERRYFEARGSIALPPPGHEGGALDLDGHFGLHPALRPLLPYYRDGSLALVHAVGSPDPTRSHFDAQDYMETGTPGRKSTPGGWLNRHLAHAVDHEATPFRGVAMGSHLPRVLRGTAPALAIDNLRTFGVGGRGAKNQRLADAFAELYRGSATGIVAASAREGFEALEMLRTRNPTALEPAAGVDYPDSRFGRSLLQLAQLIKSDVGLEIGFAEVGGWDTHINQGAANGQLAARLQDFGTALAAFAEDLGPRLADVVVLTMSEFGRTLRENGSRGTDHGRATAMMVLGGSTRGGRVLGRWPTLDEDRLVDGRDLAVTTDFRDLFGEILVRHLGQTDLEAVFPGYGGNPERWIGVIPA